ELRQGRSTLDFVGDQAQRLNASLSAADRQRLDQYLTSVRELEQRLPRPPARRGRALPRQTQIMFDVIRLALETDSSRLVSLFIDATVIHNITHHGNRPEVLAELRAKEESQFDALAHMLKL